MVPKSLLAAISIVVLAVNAVAESDDELVTKFKTREHAGTAERDKLFDVLFETYKKYNYPENSTTKFGVAILDVDFDTEHDLMNTNVWIRMTWTDSRFKWDEKEYGVSVLRVPSSKVWIPDMTLYNGVHPNMECYDSNVLIFPSGTVLWVPPCRLQSYCNLTLNRGSYEEQECQLKFGSWTFDGFSMGLELYSYKNNTVVDVENYHNRKYKITKNIAIREEKTYDCCVEPYYNILFTMGFKRIPEGAALCENQ